MATIDVDRLRAYLEDYTGTAAFGGLPAALVEVFDVEGMGPHKLCERAGELGIDLGDFTTDA